MGGRAVGLGCGESVGELIGRRLSQNQCAGFLQTGNGSTVFGGDVFLQRFGSTRGGSAFVDVLDPNRNSVQGSAVMTPLDFCFRLPSGFHHSVVEHRVERPKLGFEAIDPSQTLLGHFDRRHLPVLDESRQLGDR